MQNVAVTHWLWQAHQEDAQMNCGMKDFLSPSKQLVLHMN